MVNFLPLLQDRDVLVLGLGASGLALARWCAKAGARVTVADTRAAPPQAATLAAELPAVTLVQSAFDAELFQRRPWAMVCRSPGIAPAQLSALARAAQAIGVPVVGELGLFAQALATLAQPAEDSAPYQPKVLAITGTNGKTTTTALTAHLLEWAGVKVAVAGNIGPTLLDTLQARLDSGELPEAWVLELSSFQLDGMQGFEPTAATVLNVTQDHLDWHGGMAAYAEAKSRIFGQRALMLLNRDDATVMGWQPRPQTVQEGRRTRTVPARANQSFGTEAPQRAGDWGLETVNGMSWLVRALPADETVRRGRAAEEEEIHLQRLMPAEALRIRGRHNASNALAALALATAAGAPLAPMLHGLREYRGEPHRVEPVAIVGAVEYIDDSKGTNVGATLAALKGLGPERKLVVILGGDGKGQDFGPLAEPVARYVRAVALIGRDAAEIRAALVASRVPLHDCATLPEAVQWCARQAQAGDAVLLSPACASLDMFKDYAHRAQVFVEAVRELQQDEGTPA
ncbi:UDP-N-acetylmuramoyl-L-alanine--D-glutamate ligase [Malikia sp.]|uniref:UDP-N-acetylmuramoyl-L-alanine--D-glutamate ligase n=1 Tax=Malikia sp. TaxID=2070706 RepID=UPI00261015EE|nr:UDP-N-acetylmuramoyl-L-alanine--D-glutamate ligase [Malikia sp.]MDD2727825.1 UDP-N-acetylmuramoyl-L-alanine--D-glutamate ligase [Malikia sp.]